jgi:hypothetical protein
VVQACLPEAVSITSVERGANLDETQGISTLFFSEKINLFFI